MTSEERPGGEGTSALSGDHVGRALAKRRADKGLSLEEIGNKLKFAPRQLEALEAGRFDALPQGTFLRGMVRSYARLLDMDPQPLLQALAANIDLPDADRLAARYSQPVPFSDPGKRLNVVYAVLSVAVLLVAGAVAFEWRASRTQQAGTADPVTSAPEAAGQRAAAGAPGETVMTAPAAAPEATVEATPQAAAQTVAVARRHAQGKAKVVRFKFERESWVQVKDASGHVLMARLNERGTQSAVEGEPPFSVVIGNAQHVRVLYEEAPVDLSPHIKLEVARFTLP